MSNVNFQLSDIHRRRAELLGEEGLAWIEDLPSLIARLESCWQIKVTSQLSGGTEALVLAVVGGTGEPVVLKIGQPGSLTHEIRALQIAEGEGYARLIACDEENDALLLEGLGDKLVDGELSAAEQLDIVCRTVQNAWREVPDPRGLMTGAEKARWHLDWMQTQWQVLGEPCSRLIVDRGLVFAEEREAAFDPATSVLVHGDGHAWNTLAVPGRPDTYKLVDPDGFFMEPAYDLGISLREWIDELNADGDPLSSGKARCELLAGRTGVPERAIWQWGFIEHVSSGLLYLQLQQPDSAAPHLNIADAWLSD